VVETLVVEPEPVEDVVDFVGQLETAESVVIKPEISGVVEEVAFEEGRPVAAGDPLVTLRDDEQRARLAEARAQRALAEDVYRRTRELADMNARSAAELERAKAEFEIAQARLELARIELKRTVIRAPFAGVMGAKLVAPGERVTPGGGDSGNGGGQATGLARIEALDRMELVFTVPETVVGLVEVGSPLELRVASWPGEVFHGEVFFLAPRINEANRRVLVKARVPNPDHKLLPGMFANLRAVVARKEAALMVPEDAVMFAQEGTAVWRIGPDGTAQRTPVALGIRREGRVEITEGLDPGDEVVVSGTHKVIADRPVDAVRVGAVAAPGAGA
jgi:membrane fusion protein (multidrug efflux system)